MFQIESMLSYQHLDGDQETQKKVNVIIAIETAIHLWIQKREKERERPTYLN